MLKISHSPQKISFQAKNIPQKTVTIIRKNGKDIVKDEFVGFHAVRPNFLEVVRDLFESFFDLLSK